MKEKILSTVSDLVSNLLYYDRKDDEDLNVGDIQEAISTGEITVDDIVKRFASELYGRLSNN